MLPRIPGQSAIVFVAFAWIGGTPTSSSAGKLRKLPPPATAFIIPLTTAIPKSNPACCMVST